MNFPQLISCNVCPRNCSVDRSTTTGYCNAGEMLKINLATLHMGEEPPLSGTKGSGTIFFSWCNLGCIYCQNHSISRLGWGFELSPEELCTIMLTLQDKGAHNINLVTPTHFTPQLAHTIRIAKAQGLTIPVVWNSSAYEHVSTLQSLRGLVDIYLPDFKYAHGIYAAKYSQAPDYPAIAFAAIKEMHAQVGLLKLDYAGIANQGMLVRLLVLPGGISGTRQNLRRLASELGNELSISLMSQYYPTEAAEKYPELQREITKQEYDAVLDTASELGFTNVFCQQLGSSGTWTPHFLPDKLSSEHMEIKEFNPLQENCK